MLRSLFTACVLVLMASSAHAFVPATSFAPGGISLRPAVAGQGSVKGGHEGSRCNGFTAKLLHAKRVQQGGSSALKMKGSESLEQLFPGAIAEDKFIENMSRVGMDLGFNPNTVINFVSTCKDDISRTFTTKLDSLWGESFDIESISPKTLAGKQRYIFWVAPQISLGAGSISSASSALTALNNQIAAAKASVRPDSADTELVLLRQQVLGKLAFGQQPNLVGITYAAHDCVVDQVRNTAELATPKSSEYIIISGIQVNCDAINFWWPGSVTHHANGLATDLSDKYAKILRGSK